MRHQTKKHTLGKAQDQRKALLRSLATELFVHVITMAKKGDLNSRRLAGRYIFDKEIGQLIDTTTGEIFDAPQEGKKLAKQTVLRKLFSVIGVKYSSRQGGYTRIFRLPPRRGDASEMALIQLV